MEDTNGDNNITGLFRLHEGVSGASRAENVQDLHRLQKSSTRPRVDGEMLLLACLTFNLQCHFLNLCMAVMCHL